MRLQHGQLWQTLVAQLKADMRKTAILAVMSVVMCVVWGRLMLKQSKKKPVVEGVALAVEMVQAPSTAHVTSPSAQPAALVSEISIATRLGITPVDNRDAPRELSRDPFDADWTQFESAMSARPDGPGATSAASPIELWQALRNTMRTESSRRHKLAASVRTEAKRLTLQSTVVGADPVAMISGKVVRVGEFIDSFEVSEILPKAVVVRKDGIAVLLQMP